jgi:GDP-L-fucose synthase
MERYDSHEIVNVGTGVDLSIRDLAMLIKDSIGFEGGLNFNSEYPDGTPQKLLDTSKINALGWFPKKSLVDGIKEVCFEYANQATNLYEVSVR